MACVLVEDITPLIELNDEKGIHDFDSYSCDLRFLELARDRGSNTFTHENLDRKKGRESDHVNCIKEF